MVLSECRIDATVPRQLYCHCVTDERSIQWVVIITTFPMRVDFNPFPLIRLSILVRHFLRAHTLQEPYTHSQDIILFPPSTHRVGRVFFYSSTPFPGALQISYTLLYLGIQFLKHLEAELPLQVELDSLCKLPNSAIKRLLTYHSLQSYDTHSLNNSMHAHDARI
jgi:hypothetical protein